MLGVIANTISKMASRVALWSCPVVNLCVFHLARLEVSRLCHVSSPASSLYHFLFKSHSVRTLCERFLPLAFIFFSDGLFVGARWAPRVKGYLAHMRAWVSLKRGQDECHQMSALISVLCAFPLFIPLCWYLSIIIGTEFAAQLRNLKGHY